MNRRTFLQHSLAGASVLALGGAAPTSAPSKFILSAPLTHSDWMLKPNIAWGPDGVKHMLDACQACGWSRVHWRAFDGGLADYPSKVARPMGSWDEDNFWNPKTPEDKALAEKFGVTAAKGEELNKRFAAMDYAKFDAFGEAVRYGHSIGLKIDAWVTINEDDHGWGISSDFAKQHPQFRWKKRDGRFYKSQMSFAFPEVRAYKLAILKELLDKYEIDGIFLDWIRTGDVRDNPQTDANGIADNGYEDPNIQAFKQKYNADPHEVPNDDDRWVRLRAEPQNVFMRDVRELVNEHRRRVPISALVGHPWHYRGFNDPIDGNLRGLLLDVKTWANESLIDAAVAAGYYRAGGNAELAYRALQKETDNKVDVWTYAWVPDNAAEAEATLALAERVGAKQILFWEADYIDDRAEAAAVKQILSQQAK